MNNIARPSAYESAIRSKERAREDIQVSLEVFQMSKLADNRYGQSHDVNSTKKPVHLLGLASAFVTQFSANYNI